MSVLDKVAGDIERVLQSDMANIEDPFQKMEIFVNVCFDVVRSTREYYQVNMDFWTQINQKDEVRAVIARHYAKFRETAAKVVRQGLEAGKFRKVDPAQYGSFVIAVIDGLSLQWLFDDKVFDYDGMVKVASRLIIEGLLPERTDQRM